jgi:hypothetical protein
MADETLARDEGILVANPAQLDSHPKVTDRVAQIVETANSELQSYARVKKFAVLPYHALLDSLYA